MNKKRIGALLIGATLLVGALGSFAYFTSKTGVSGNGADGALQKLNITNGTVVITAEVDSGEGANYDWSYDVARVSSPIEEYQIDQHRSPDINVSDEDKTSVKIGEVTLSRANIGAALPNVVEFTRPGDAIVLGAATEEGSEANGLTIQNSSNLTIKVRLIVKDTDSNKDGIQNAQIQAMEAAGWKMYINRVEVELSKLIDGVNLGVVSANGTMPGVDIRFELPTSAGNEYQDDVAAGGQTGALDLNQLIEIQATQENNKYWEQMDQENYVPDQGLNN